MDFIRMSTRRVHHIEDDCFLSKSLHHLKKLLDLSLLYAGWLGNLEVIDQVFFLVRAAEEKKKIELVSSGLLSKTFVQLTMRLFQTIQTKTATFRNIISIMRKKIEWLTNRAAYWNKKFD